ncbi:hypothetical protein KR054_005917 [Drosophila jambulina]|nr:hypothetical protein KR054_005917 [Drosophila jambulina]
MKVISLCLLVVASASFLLTTASVSPANALESYDDMYDVEWDVSGLIAELSALEDMEGELMDVEAYGFIGGCKNVLWKGYKGVNGTLCIINEVIDIMGQCTAYISNIGKCTVNVPKDVLAIVDTAKQMVTISNSIIHLRSQLCAAPTTADTRGLVTATKNSFKCFIKLFKATMGLVRRMNIMIKQSGRLPSDTNNCFVGATKSIVGSCNAFVPNINTCIAHM